MHLVFATAIHSRPQYGRQFFEAIARFHDKTRWSLLVVHDPGGDADPEKLTRGLGLTLQIERNPARLGADATISRCWEIGAEIGTHVVYADEDVVFAPDSLDYFTWAVEQLTRYPSLFAATAYNRAEDPGPASRFAAKTRFQFHPWGVCLSRERIAEVLPAIAARSSPLRSWDTVITEEFVRPGSLKEIYPLLSRVRNIGAVSSVHDYSPAWHADHHAVPAWSGDTSSFVDASGWFFG